MNMSGQPPSPGYGAPRRSAERVGGRAEGGGQTAEGRGQPPSLGYGALFDGMARVAQSPVILGCVYLATLVTAVPFSMLMRDSIAGHLGNSLAAEEAARD